MHATALGSSLARFFLPFACKRAEVQPWWVPPTPKISFSYIENSEINIFCRQHCMYMLVNKNEYHKYGCVQKCSKMLYPKKCVVSRVFRVVGDPSIKIQAYARLPHFDAHNLGYPNGSKWASWQRWLVQLQFTFFNLQPHTFEHNEDCSSTTLFRGRELVLQIIQVDHQARRLNAGDADAHLPSNTRLL